MDAFETVWHRMLELAEAQTDAQLGAFLGISQTAVGKQRRKRNIPNSWYDVFRKKAGVTWEELNRGAVARHAVANGAANQTGVNHGTVAGVVHAVPAFQPVVGGGGGDIARELCGLIARRLEGMSMDEQIAFRARVKKALEGE